VDNLLADRVDNLLTESAVMAEISALGGVSTRFAATVCGCPARGDGTPASESSIAAREFIWCDWTEF